MREYLFRGKAKYENILDDFVYGLLTKDCNEYLIDGVPVDPNTVGQYVLVEDKYGKKIFENDIVAFHYFGESYDHNTLGYEEEDINFAGVVQVDQWGNYAVPIQYFFEPDPIKPKYYFVEYLTDPDEELKIIGNIYDNPIATPPGSTIKEQLDEWSMPLEEFAKRMGMTEKIAVKLMNGNISLTEEIAEKLEDIFNIPAIFWINMETLYRKRLKKFLKDVKEI